MKTWHVCYVKKYPNSQYKKFLHYTNLVPKWDDECNHVNDIDYWSLQLFLKEIGFNIG